MWKIPFKGWCFGGLLTIALPAVATHPGAVALGAGTLSAPINTETAVPVPKGHLAGGLRTEFLKFNPLSDDQLLHLRERHPEADLHSTESLWTTSLLIAYGLTRDLTVGVRIPYVRRNKLREPPHAGGERHGHGIEHLGSAAGLGDLVLFGQYRFLHWPEKSLHAALLLGVKMPSGVTDRHSRGGTKLETELQPGSGSWDGIFGLSLTQNFAAWTVNASAVYTVVTEGNQRTDLGDIFSYNLALSYRLPWGHWHQGEYFFLEEGGFGIDLILEYNGQWRERTEISGHRDRNSGGHVGFLSPGLRLLFGRHTNLGVSFGVPVVDDLNGDQDNLDFRVVGSLNFYF